MYTPIHIYIQFKVTVRSITWFLNFTNPLNLVENGWIHLSASAFNLLKYIVLTEVHDKNMISKQICNRKREDVFMVFCVIMGNAPKFSKWSFSVSFITISWPPHTSRGPSTHPWLTAHWLYGNHAAKSKARPSGSVSSPSNTRGTFAGFCPSEATSANNSHICTSNNLPQHSECFIHAFSCVPRNFRDLLKNWCLLNLKFHFIKKDFQLYWHTFFCFCNESPVAKNTMTSDTVRCPALSRPWQPLSYKHCLYSCTQMSTPWKIKCFDIIMKIGSSAFLRIAALKCKKKIPWNKGRICTWKLKEGMVIKRTFAPS